MSEESQFSNMVHIKPVSWFCATSVRHELGLLGLPQGFSLGTEYIEHEYVVCFPLLTYLCQYFKLCNNTNPFCYDGLFRCFRPVNIGEFSGPAPV
jgi:hypothetical protein